MVEILHDTGYSISSAEEYKRLCDYVYVGKRDDSQSRMVRWAWQENWSALDEQPPSSLAWEDRSFVWYRSGTSNAIESAYQLWRKDRTHENEVTSIDLAGKNAKKRSYRTGFKYEINFEKMVQTNCTSRAKRKVCRIEHFHGDGEGLLDLLPRFRLSPLSLRKQAFLPTFQGQIVEVLKMNFSGQWWYGKDLYDPEEANGLACRSKTHEGWFPKILCKPSRNAFLALARFKTNTLKSMPFDFALPETWEPGRKGLVTLCETSGDYYAVHSLFRKSFESPDEYEIQSIGRVQQHASWKRYGLFRHQMQQRYSNGTERLINGRQSQIEMKLLFHGTRADAVPQIIRQGFNRSYAGTHGSVYGKGCYFGRYAGQAMHFAKPDSNGVMSMFLCSVAVGDYCKGKFNQIKPDSRPGSPYELFNSTVDDVKQPTIFVTYHDDQAYPEYLVTFKKKSRGDCLIM